MTSRSGIDLKKHYYTLLSKLGEESVGRVAHIYANASSSIEEPKNLEKIITEIDKLDWYEAKEEGLGDLYEGLLEKNANEKKSGAGQYFTPRVLIDVMIEVLRLLECWRMRWRKYAPRRPTEFFAQLVQDV